MVSRIISGSDGRIYPKECSGSSWHDLLTYHGLDSKVDEARNVISTLRMQENMKVMWNVFSSEVNTAR